MSKLEKEVEAGIAELVELNSELSWIHSASSPVERLASYAELVLKWNGTHNLVGPCDGPTFVRNHLCDCFAVSRFLSKELMLSPALAYVDVGSGAGLPAAILAINEPKRAVFAVEPREKRHLFLREVRRLLRIDNLIAERCKFLDFELPATIIAGGVLSRALTNDTSFIQQASKVLRKDGFLGQMCSPKQELRPEQTRITYRLPGGLGSRCFAFSSVG